VFVTTAKAVWFRARSPMNRSHWSNPPMATFSFAAPNRFVTPSSICESGPGFDFRRKDRHGSVRGASCGLPWGCCRFSTMNLNFRRRECPLWVISGHWRTSSECPLYPRKRTSTRAIISTRPSSGRLPSAVWMRRKDGTRSWCELGAGRSGQGARVCD